MRKIFLCALAVVAGSVVTTGWAGNNKDKKKKAEAPVQRVTLQTTSDSVSYVAGYSATAGLLSYL